MNNKNILFFIEILPSYKYETDILLKMLCLSEDYVLEDVI